MLLGPPGVGKTHLAIALGIKAVEERKRVLFYSAEKLTYELASAEVSGQLNSKLESLARLDLLIIDELGDHSLTNQTSKLFFQLVFSQSCIIISNPSTDG